MKKCFIIADVNNNKMYLTPVLSYSDNQYLSMKFTNKESAVDFIENNMQDDDVSIIEEEME